MAAARREVTSFNRVDWVFGAIDALLLSLVGYGVTVGLFGSLIWELASSLPLARSRDATLFGVFLTLLAGFSMLVLVVRRRLPAPPKVALKMLVLPVIGIVLFFTLLWGLIAGWQGLIIGACNGLFVSVAALQLARFVVFCYERSWTGKRARYGRSVSIRRRAAFKTSTPFRGPKKLTSPS